MGICGPCRPAGTLWARSASIPDRHAQLPSLQRPQTADADARRPRPCCLPLSCGFKSGILVISGIPCICYAVYLSTVVSYIPFIFLPVYRLHGVAVVPLFCIPVAPLSGVPV